MRRPMAKKVLAATMAAAMTMSLVACGEEAPAAAPAADPAPADTATSEAAPEEAPEEEASKYTALIDPATGEAYDLGGIEIIVRDWYSPADGAYPEPQNELDEATLEYREWLQETYNFTLKQMAISDWGSTPNDFVEYCTAKGDENNYLFILRADPAVTSAISNNMAFDLATLDCLDFDNDPIFANGFHESYTFGDSIYAFYPGQNEPRTGVYFNERILEEYGIDWNEIYDKQAAGTWCWDDLRNYMETIVSKDADGDGTPDVYGFADNHGMLKMAVYSNGGHYIDKAEDGSYRYALGDTESIDGLAYAAEMYNKYQWQAPADAQWDAYKNAFLNGEYAFCVEDLYYAYGNNSFDAMEDEVGFVMFPKGTSDKACYTNVFDNNIHVIPACYDAEKAWKIAFAFDQWMQVPAGFEDYDGFTENCRKFGLVDGRAVDETVAMMEANGQNPYYNSIANLQTGPDFEWGFGGWSDAVQSEEAIRDTWTSYVNAANAVGK